MYYYFDHIYLDSHYSRISLVLLSYRRDPSRVISLKKYKIYTSSIYHIKNEDHHIKILNNHIKIVAHHIKKLTNHIFIHNMEIQVLTERTITQRQLKKACNQAGFR